MKICVIIPYFGSVPENIDSFLYSASFNPQIDWLIFTDQSEHKFQEIPNVRIIASSFQEVRSRIQSVVGKKICLDAPYKLCDYKPLYGLAFQDYLKDYDYWGYGDLDVVCGNIMKFISKGLEDKYDRIGDLGHFTLYRNDKNINERYNLSIKDKHGNMYKPFSRVYKHSRGYAFDELGMRAIYKYYKFSTYTNEDLVNETKTGCLDLYSIDPRFRHTDGVFIWNMGKCLYYFIDSKTGDMKSHEFGYFHIAKRHHFSHYLHGKNDCFGVATDGYFKLDNSSNESVKFIMSINHSSFLDRLFYSIKSYFFSGDITFREIFGIHLPIFELYREIKNGTFRI